MVLRISIGANGEFFIETDAALTPEGISAAEILYRRILTAKNECEIIDEAMRSSGKEDV